MWLMFLYGSAIGIFAGVIYLILRFIFAAENGGSYPGLEDLFSREYEKI